MCSLVGSYSGDFLLYVDFLPLVNESDFNFGTGKGLSVVYTHPYNILYELDEAKAEPVRYGSQI